MSKIVLTREQTKYLWGEECSEELGLVLQEEGEWYVDYKWQHITNIYFQESTGKYYEMTISRSGSPYTDYYYSHEDSGAELNEVKLVERKVVTKSWESV
jgi:hypothetical protein